MSAKSARGIKVCIPAQHERHSPSCNHVSLKAKNEVGGGGEVLHMSVSRVRWTAHCQHSKSARLLASTVQPQLHLRAKSLHTDHHITKYALTGPCTCQVPNFTNLLAPANPENFS